MRKAGIVVIVLLAVFVPAGIHAIFIGDFPGWKELIDSADAIVILRIDRYSDTHTVFMTPYRTYQCFIYQTLKGDIPKDSQIELELMDARFEFVSPYALSSTHLMFLAKEEKGDEPAVYWTLPVKGANIEVSPFGQEKPPRGATIEEQIRNLVKSAIAYRAKEHEKHQKFLRSLLEEHPEAETTD